MLTITSRCFTVVFFLWATKSFAENWPLHIDISGAQPTGGEVIVALFDEEQDFLMKPLRTVVQSVADNGMAQVVFDGLEQGEYAVSVIYDENGDGTLARNKRGMPLEATGFSKNAKARFGPPSFSAASFQHQPDTVIAITLYRWKKNSKASVEVDASGL